MATATATPTATPTARAVTDCYADCNPHFQRPHPHTNSDAGTSSNTQTVSEAPASPDSSGDTDRPQRAINETKVTTSSFTANWSSVSGATGYRLDVSTNRSFSSYIPGYQNLDVGNTTSYNVTGLSPNTFYFYRLRAYNDNGTSRNSNVIKIKTNNRTGPSPNSNVIKATPKNR